MLDTDSVFHGVDPVAPGVDAPVLRARRRAGRRRRATADAGRCRDADGAHVATYDWDELRFSVSWKAYCFADEAERDAWRDHTDDLTTDAVVDRLVDDLVDPRGRPGRTCPSTANSASLMIDEYVRYPGTPTAA